MRPLDSRADFGNEWVRPLVIDDRAKEEARRVRGHAEAHPYRPGPGVAPPGDDPRYCCQLNTYRCVFSVTHVPSGVYRHLSISVPGEKYPNPAAVLAIADLFGFTGWDGKTVDRFPADWLADVNREEHCVVLAQRLAGPAPEASEAVVEG